MSTDGIHRRTLLAGTACLGALAAAACSTAPAGDASAPPEGAPSAPAPAPPPAAGADLGPVDAVPVGGGLVLGDRRVVLVRPAGDRVVAFSAVCTHRGCTVARVEDGAIRCPCHGSRFGLDGTVLSGPATAPLPPVPITVSGGRIRTA